MEKIITKKNIAVLIFGLVLIDQLIKFLVIRFSLFFIYNDGVAFGIGGGKLVTILVSIILTLICYQIYKGERNVGFIMILAGGISNLVDRFNYPGVIDYLPIRGFAVINFADVIINLGIIIYIFSSLYPIYKKKIDGSKNSKTSN